MSDEDATDGLDAVMRGYDEMVPPERLKVLEEVEDCLRVFYEQHDGGFVLTAHGRSERAAFIKHIERIKAEARKDYQQCVDELAKLKRQHRDLLVGSALTTELRRAGCRPGLTEAARALLEKRHRIEVGDADRVYALVDDEEIPVERIARDFMASADAFREPPRAADGPGEYERQVRAMFNGSGRWH